MPVLLHVRRTLLLTPLLHAPLVRCRPVTA